MYLRLVKVWLPGGGITKTVEQIRFKMLLLSFEIRASIK
ncbi:hypothetical protein CES85_4214 [Ochrobactrum quorumnocens]|uniref:Uncharacterized protein n=1 Tax=Ochrobactrum quorumnocens TaxID=271865 RepID=A0A248U9Q3_9HYPH|nr:hypothetical protein CES85_4214 [[Ochrobactrum] quorumnocens]